MAASYARAAPSWHWSWRRRATTSSGRKLPAVNPDGNKSDYEVFSDPIRADRFADRRGRARRRRAGVAGRAPRGGLALLRREPAADLEAHRSDQVQIRKYRRAAGRARYRAPVGRQAG